MQVYSVTSDGHASILKAVKRVYPNAIIQRCVVHVKRQASSWLGQYPKLEVSKTAVAYHQANYGLDTMEDVNDWLIEFNKWYGQHSVFINEQSMSEETGRMWYTHKNLHAACSHVINAIHIFSII